MMKKTVLVVQSEIHQRMVYVAIFDYGEYAIDTVATNEEAVARLKKLEWDVVVIGMTVDSGINGFELLDTYTHDPAYIKAKNHPVLIVFTDDEGQAEQLRHRVDEVFVMNGFDPGEVLEKVQERLQQRQSLETTSPAA